MDRERYPGRGRRLVITNETGAMPPDDIHGSDFKLLGGVGSQRLLSAPLGPGVQGSRFKTGAKLQHFGLLGEWGGVE